MLEPKAQARATFPVLGDAPSTEKYVNHLMSAATPPPIARISPK
jgi:hypothetical protein